ncbi:MAG: RNA polymerase sigma factor [Thermoanaerobaculia bacterium]
MDNPSGWQIVQRCLQTADGPAWGAFVERFETPMVWGIQRALRSLGFRGRPRDVIGDLLQECYCRILARDRRTLKLCRERKEPALDAYFARVAERSTRDSFRARWAEKRGSRDLVVGWNEVVEDRHAASGESSPEDRLLIREARSKLLETCHRAAGSRKRERNFRVLVLAFLEGLSTREIAEQFAGRLSRSCIDSLVYRARRRLLKEGVVLGNRGAVA